MIDAQKPNHVSLNSLISWLREGRFVIPDFQREFEWAPWDVNGLIRSIFLDYYIGSLLLWKGKPENFQALECEQIYGHKGEQRSEYIVLDGQQRLTALYYACFSPDVNYRKRASRFFFYVRVDQFMAEEYDKAFEYQAQTKRFMEILNNQEEQFRSHIFPLGLIGSLGFSLSNWLQDYEKFWLKELSNVEVNNQLDQLTVQVLIDNARNHISNAQEFSKHIQSITGQYQISYIELDRDIALDKVCDIFTQINSKGVRLDVFDLINALLKPKGLQLKQMWREASNKLDFVDSEKMNVYILQVMSIMLQFYCSPKYLYYLLPGQTKKIRLSDGSFRNEVLIPSTEQFEVHWSTAVGSLESSIKLLRHPQEFGVISTKYLPYVSILPVFAALTEYISKLEVHKRLDSRRKFKHWYWASVFNSRYSGSVESTSARDYQDLIAWFNDDLAEPSLIQTFNLNYKNMELRKEIKSGTSVYNGIFNLLVLQGAQDWINGHVAQYDDLDDHHIVPASWGKNNLKDNSFNTILNRTPISSDTNRNIIRDRLPNAYLPELIKANGRDVVEGVMDSHFISNKALEILLRDPFTPDDFEIFINERQKTIQEAIQSLLVKERLDLSPNLRMLDEEVEKVELTLRNLINASLNEDFDLLPSHVLQKANERIQSAARRNAAFDQAGYQTLAKKLEFFDLRELQDTICNGSCWAYFQAVFLNKESLNIKFSQLAELRNAIRHSRAVDEIARKEGEAAILWFNQVANKT